MDVTNAEQAKSALYCYVEAEVEHEEPVLVERKNVMVEEADQEENSSIIGQINKRIRLERHLVKRLIWMLEFIISIQEVESASSTSRVTVESVLDEYFAAPLEEVRCLRWEVFYIFHSLY